MQTLPTSLAGEYERMSTERSPYLERARKAAKFTLPTLIPPEGHTSGNQLRYGYSNFGARCVNTMASRFLLALLPARQAFFRYVLADEVMASLKPDEVTQVEEALAGVESAIQTDLETTQTRGPAGEMFKHLQVAGNVLAYDLPDGGLKIFPLSRFCVTRDGSGNWTAIIALEFLSLATLPNDIRSFVEGRLRSQGREREKTVKVYTGIFRTAGGYSIWQEVEGFKIPGTEGTYTFDNCPWFPLRGIPVDGESYGRAHVEDYLGYFISLEGLTAAIVKGTAAISKLVYLRNPNGTTKASAVAKAETGDVVDGKVEDIRPLQSEKSADFAQAREVIRDLKEELAFAFGLSSAVQRQAERVTAEEIRYVAQQIDSAHAGGFSWLAQDFQLPLLKSRMARLQRQRKLPSLPEKAVRPMIVTGLDALGRGAELDNLQALIADIKVVAESAEAIEPYTHIVDLINRLTTARGIKPKGLVKSQNEVAASLQQRQMQAMVQHLGPNAVTQMGQLAKAGAAPSTQGTQ